MVRLSLAQGASLCTFGVLVGIVLLVAGPRVRPFPLEILLLLASWWCFWFFSHDLAHHATGRLLGVGFRYYFLGKSGITKLRLPFVSALSRRVPVLGLKIDASTLTGASFRRVQAMHLSGATASIFLPFAILPTAYAISSLVGEFFAGLTFVNLVFTIYFSERVGDFHRARMVHEALKRLQGQRA